MSWGVKVKFLVFSFVFSVAVELHRQHGCGSGHRRLQRGPELLHEQAEKPPEHADVHRPVQPIPSECGTEEVLSESPRKRRLTQLSASFCRSCV